MPSNRAKIIRLIVALFVVVLVVLFGFRFLQKGKDGSATKNNQHPVPVEVGEVRNGSLVLYRVFSGTIEPQAQFTVAPKVNGRIQRLSVDVSDKVQRGQLVAQFEDAEFRQAVAEAEARQAVAEANKIEAESRLEIAQRQLDRTKSLHERGIASDSVFDTAQAEYLASQAAVKVAEAVLKREDAALAGARIRLGYTLIKADWEQGDDERIVAERYADEGNTVPANTPLFSIVELDPVIAVIQVTEKDYPRLEVGHQAILLTDAFPDREFSGTVSRIAPIFSKLSRQARVEIQVVNQDYLLKPGMFVRCTMELAKLEDTLNVPETAITKRNNQDGIFLVAEDGLSVEWLTVRQGLRTQGRVQLLETEIAGKVVTLGQQFVKDGSAIRIVHDSATSQGVDSSQ